MKTDILSRKDQVNMKEDNKDVQLFMEEFMKALGITRQLSMAYHPQTDGQTEQINQEIEMFLQHYVNYQQDNWTDWLAAAEFQYNDKKICSNRENTVLTKLWKTSMEGQSCGTIKVSKIRRIPCRITEELGAGHKVNEKRTEEYKEAV